MPDKELPESETEKKADDIKDASLSESESPESGSTEPSGEDDDAAEYVDVQDAETIDVAAAAPAGERGFPFKDKKILAIGAILLLLLVAIAWDPGLIGLGDDDDDEEPPVVQGIQWNEPVWIPREVVDDNNGQEFPEYAIGYEPSIAVDSQGNLFYTAHKDLRWCAPGGGPLSGSPFPPGAGITGYDTTWDYYASWFFASNDGGETWGPPGDWGLADWGSELPGDEGDIGVDAEDRIYFSDTTLEDDWLHIWTDGGNNYVNGQRLQSMTADDRPWITAQGDGIVHFLGNNGVPVPGIPLTSGTSGVGRYWYYRGVLDPTGTYVVFDQGRALEGGWAHISAERDGEHVYIAQVAEEGTGGIKVWVSDDTGITWNEPIIVGPMEGTHPEGYPWMGIGQDGHAYVAWQESPQGGRTPGTLYIASTEDHGQTWEHWDITAGYPHEEGGVYLYPNLEVGPHNIVAYTFYANIGNHSAGDEWHLYAAALVDPQPGDIFNFTKADPFPLHTSSEQEAQTDDLHPLHDLFEVVVSPADMSINIAYQYNIGDHPFEDGEEQRYLMYVKGDLIVEEE